MSLELDITTSKL